jgi:hypothetical protein
MYSHSELNYARLRTQAFYDEAERNRMIRQSGLWDERRKNRWWMVFINQIPGTLRRWSCEMRLRLSQGFSGGFLPGAGRLALVNDECTCAAEPCAD